MQVRYAGFTLTGLWVTLIKRHGGTKITEDDIECDDHVKMEGKHIGKIVGRFYGKDIPHLTKAEKIERDILDELSTLRQKVADMEKAKAFSVEIFDNIVRRLNAIEDHLRILDRILSGLELQRLRGNG